MTDLVIVALCGFALGSLLTVYLLRGDTNDDELVQAGYEQGLIVGRQMGER